MITIKRQSLLSIKFLVLFIFLMSCNNKSAEDSSTENLKPEECTLDVETQVKLPNGKAVKYNKDGKVDASSTDLDATNVGTLSSKGSDNSAATLSKPENALQKN